MVFKLDFKTPSNAQFPKGFTVLSNCNYVNTNISDKPLKTVDILGYDIDYKLIANAIKSGRGALASLVKSNISSDTKAVRY